MAAVKPLQLKESSLAGQTVHQSTFGAEARQDLGWNRAPVGMWRGCAQQLERAAIYRIRV